ncbi:lytic transglycosylase domain-containing protein [Paraburkholderia sartisoli]|uniref:Transglycosylase SLT domain-containing protein n=1 Tax=Paraburkholderia sartisoli TaxID=83784 RepID=A0A1H4GGL1_9BURK|nr:lytic transglycosylase domain-containing protein [Paraburkholderia sartisoli]SEB08765.1 Transglycosylase SLT domain-containing protein [Paraburkholderia sartisoli]
MIVGGLGHDDGRAPAGGPLAVVVEPANRKLPAIATRDARIMALAPLIDEAAYTTGIDPALLMAVIDVESGGNAQAVSPKGASGLMQLMPSTAARHGALNVFDPKQNIAAGARYLSRLLQQFHDLPLALAAYNAGEAAVRKYGDQIPPFAETLAYVPRVIDRYQRYRSVDERQGRFLLVRRDGVQQGN